MDDPSHHALPQYPHRIALLKFIQGVRLLLRGLSGSVWTEELVDSVKDVIADPALVCRPYLH